MMDKYIKEKLDNIAKRIEELYGTTGWFNTIIRVDPNNGQEPFGEYYGDSFVDNWEVLSVSFGLPYECEDE